jgi:acetyl-CoA C-acetyltransferase
MKAHGLTEEDMAGLPVYEYANAAHNPDAHMKTTRKPVTEEAVLGSYRLFEDPRLPLKLFECSQISDGWARLVVADEEGLSQLGIAEAETTRLVGFGAAVEGLSMASRGEDLIRPRGARKAFHEALDMASASPGDVSLQEVHDCFSVMLPIAAETTGLAEVGRGLDHYRSGNAAVDGSCPINTSGGLIAKGHPIGATGVAMIGWVHKQLRGLVPDALQVRNPSLGTTLNIGGPICSTVVTAQRPTG